MEYKSLDTAVVVTVMSLVINIQRQAEFSGWVETISSESPILCSWQEGHGVSEEGTAAVVLL